MTDPHTVFGQAVPAQLAAHPDLAERVDAVLQVDIDGPDGGIWSIDLRRDHAPPTVAPGPHPAAKVRVRLAAADFRDLMAGRQRWTDAFVRGKVRFDGDLVVALKLRNLLPADGAG